MNWRRALRISFTAVILAVLFGVSALGSGQWLSSAAAYVGVLIIWSVNAWPERIREVGPYAALLGGIAPAIVLHNRNADREFFVLAAEVIPLLFLAMVAGESFSLLNKQEPDRRVRTLLVYILILGESFSLYVIASRHEPAEALGWAVGALIAAAITIISAAVGDEPKKEEHGPRGGPG